MATLDGFDVPKPEQDELLALLGPMGDGIVEVESAETGTPLPRHLPTCTGPDLIGEPVEMEIWPFDWLSRS